MTGAPPYNAQSPTQQHRYPAYESPSKNQRPYYPNNEQPQQSGQQQYPQHPPQTPPAFPSSSISRSPRFSHASSPMPGSLPPPINGAAPPAHPSHLESSTQYQPHSTSGTPSLPPPHSLTNPALPGNGVSPYGPFTPHGHPSGRPEGYSQSPSRESESPYHVRGNGVGYGSSITQEPRRSSPPRDTKPARAADPMSFASILSGPSEDKPARKPSPLPSTPAPAEQTPKTESRTRDIAPTPGTFLHKADRTPVQHKDPPRGHFAPNGISKSGTDQAEPVHRVQPRKPLPPGVDSEQVNRAITDIENADKSDVEGTGFEAEQEYYRERSIKRSNESARAEQLRRKRRRNEFLIELGRSFEKQAIIGNERFRTVNEPDVVAEVQQKEVQDEKERKKDMQRKRRRENTVRVEMQKKLEAERKADNASDSAEKAKFLREAERAQKKIKSTKRALEGGNAQDELGEVTPLAPNLEGGTTSSFHIGRSSPSRRRSGRAGPSSRPKKSKEQKQAEKDAAEAAYLGGYDDDSLYYTPRDSRKGGRSKEGTPVPLHYDSKGYNQIYEQIWRDIARKDIPKVYRIKATSLTTRVENSRKTAQLASKQSRKWQERTNKSTKDTQARAKRTMREMMSFWKRNEREERDLRRLAEKQELESAKKAEAERESNRQKRKLNFLISQTELYSHFIGRKIKTAEVEAGGDGVTGSDETIQPGKEGAHTVNLPNSVANKDAKVTNFEDLDFDADDETALQQAAMANAQNAVQEAQDRARAFDKDKQGDGDQMAAFDEGELNFQNPTSLGDIEISQPTMLTAKLKEYQLKGLNWLVNLYEQGINGILADEMGLGKTIQSISVMAYLAEFHNIWGPFLVIAPASTLHNWQQEIAKFVPNIKVLPYWGNAKDRKILRKFWDRKHITYNRDSEFHVLVTSYQLVVLDAQYFQKVKWQYMILDEAQAIKSSQSSRWKNLLGFSCRNRLLLTGTPIQNNMQELWALLHFIMPTLFDSHDEFSEWFSKDIESHAQSNTKLNEDQLKRLHMILKPFMLRRVKKNVQQELGDKVEKDIFCDLTYRQRAIYANLRNRVSIIDIIEKAAAGDDSDSTTLMNLVMQFRKVCNHPDLFERAETKSPLSVASFAECASFVREGYFVDMRYSTKNRIEYELPRLLCSPEARIDMPGPGNERAGFRGKYLSHLMNIWTPENIQRSSREDGSFSFLRFVDTSAGEASELARQGPFERALGRQDKADRLSRLNVSYDADENESFSNSVLPHSMLNIVERNDRQALRDITSEGRMRNLMNVSRTAFEDQGLNLIEPSAVPKASAPPILLSSSGMQAQRETEKALFNPGIRQALYGVPNRQVDEQILEKQLDPVPYSHQPILPPPTSLKSRYTNIEVPSMRRFVTDSGKLAKLDELLRQLKPGGHRVLLYFQMTRMIDLMEEYLTYRNYKYCRLDGSTKLEDRRDTVADFQSNPDIFVFLLSTRAGGLGINLTAADTVIFYDSDWNPTIDSQAMDRAHRLGQTRQVTVYRLITRGTIEERIRKRALQKEEVQRVVITGGASGGVDFNTRAPRENRTKDIAMWLADDDEAELLEQKEREAIERGELLNAAKGNKKAAAQKRKRDLTLEDMYHEGEGNFDDASAKPSGTATPMSENVDSPAAATPAKRGRGRGPGKGTTKRAKTTKERLRLIDGDGGLS